MSKKTKFMLRKITPEQAERTSELYAPQFEADLEVSRSVPVGGEVAGSTSKKKSRNVKHHRKYWSLIRLVYHNLPEKLTGIIRNENELHEEIKMQLGLREKRQSLSGRVYYKPGSIAFDKMNQDDFEEFYSRALDVICKWVLPGTNSHDLEMEIMEYIR